MSHQDLNCFRGFGFVTFKEVCDTPLCTALHRAAQNGSRQGELVHTNRGKSPSDLLFKGNT